MKGKMEHRLRMYIYLEFQDACVDLLLIYVGNRGWTVLGRACPSFKLEGSDLISDSMAGLSQSDLLDTYRYRKL